MLLLTIAHKGEAQEFIRRAFTQPTDYHFSGVYRDGEDILLLTGEGIEQTILRVSSVLTYFGNKIDRVVNMGIAGALEKSLQINQIYGIRQVYHEFHEEPGYPTFLCKETYSKTDCVTAYHAVEDNNYTSSLKLIAPIVDRELWGMGFVCNNYGISFKSYKLISDFAGDETDPKELISNAAYFSKHMFDFYKNLSLTKESW